MLGKRYETQTCQICQATQICPKHFPHKIKIFMKTLTQKAESLFLQVFSFESRWYMECCLSKFFCFAFFFINLGKSYNEKYKKKIIN